MIPERLLCPTRVNVRRVRIPILTNGVRGVISMKGKWRLTTEGPINSGLIVQMVTYIVPDKA